MYFYIVLIEKINFHPDVHVLILPFIIYHTQTSGHPFTHKNINTSIHPYIHLFSFSSIYSLTYTAMWLSIHPPIYPFPSTHSLPNHPPFSPTIKEHASVHSSGHTYTTIDFSTHKLVHLFLNLFFNPFSSGFIDHIYLTFIHLFILSVHQLPILTVYSFRFHIIKTGSL